MSEVVFVVVFFSHTL